MANPEKRLKNEGRKSGERLQKQSMIRDLRTYVLTDTPTCVSVSYMDRKAISFGNVLPHPSFQRQ